MVRSILHVNIDSFFAAVERKMRPELIARPVIVGAPRGNTSGVVVSASVEALKAGVEEGMTVRQAQRACENAHVVMANYALYRRFSEQFMDILSRYSPLLEPNTLGSAYLDVTASRSLFGDARRIASRIIFQVSEKLRLPVRVGCASNKLVAKAASCWGGICNPSPSQVRSGGIANPSRNSLLINQVPPGSEAAFLAPFPVGALESVTAGIEKRLSELGIATVGQLAMIPERLLVRQFGPVGSVMKEQSLGVGSSRVRAAYPPEIIMIEHTFESAPEEPAEIKQHLRKMTQHALMKLRKKSALAGEITLALVSETPEGRDEVRTPSPGREGGGEARTPSPGGEGWGEGEGQQSEYFRFKKPTDSPAHIIQVLEKLLGRNMKPGMRISGARIVFSDLQPGQGSQLCLVGESERRSRIDRAVELIKERFGEGAVIFASSLAPAGRSRVLARIAA